MTSTTATHPNATRWTLASLGLSMLLPSLDTSIANAGLPVLAESFGASFGAVQWIVLAYLLTITALIVTVGRLGDIVGRRRLLLRGIVIFTVASLICGIAPTLGVLIAARAAQGLGAAIMMTLTIALLGEALPKEKNGSAMGLLGSMSAIGTSLGPSLGSALIAGLGWRTIFLVNVPLGVANYILVRRHLPAHGSGEASRPAGFDIAGTVLLAVSLGCYSLAMTIGHGSFATHNAALLVAGGVGIALFLLVEAKAASPLIRLETFRHPGVSGSLAMSAIVSTVIMSTMVVGPFYLSQGLGLSPVQVGLALSAGPMVAALGGIPAGRIVDRSGARPMTLAGLCAMATGAASLSILPDGYGVGGYLLPVSAITAGYALFQTANNTSIMTGIEASQRGSVAGLLSLSRNLGLITGASVMGALFASATGTDNIASARPSAVHEGMRTTFAIASILIITAATIAAGVPRSMIRYGWPSLAKASTET